MHPPGSTYWIVHGRHHDPMYSRNKRGRGRGSPDRKSTQVLTESSDTVPLLYSFSPLRMSCSLCRTILWKFVLGSFELLATSWPVSWHPPWPSYVLPSLLLWFLLSTEKGWEYFSLFYFQATQLSCLHELRPRLSSSCSCLTVGGAAFLNIFNSSSSVSVDKLVDKSLHMTVFSRSLISSSRAIGVSSWIILTGTACLRFCK